MVVDQLMAYESLLRLGLFLVSLLIFALLERKSARRKIPFKQTIRWFRNLSMVVISTLLLRFTLPITATSAALLAQKWQMGIFNISSVERTLPDSIVIICSIILLDAAIYLEHVIFHHVPLLWRIHKIHHLDHAIDVSTALRFHPVEFLLSALIKVSVVGLFGMPWIAVLVFEIILNTMAMFNHANWRLPIKVDKFLRFCVVTPDMHRIHHSINPDEFNRNYGFNLAIWDKLFKTYQPTPRLPHESMEIGLKNQVNFQQSTFWYLLALPFYRKSRY